MNLLCGHPESGSLYFATLASLLPHLVLALHVDLYILDQ